MSSPLTRALLWNATWDMCRDAELPASQYVELVLRGVATESGPHRGAVHPRSGAECRQQLPRSACVRDCSPAGSRAWASCWRIRHRVRIISWRWPAASPAAAEDSSAADRMHGWLNGKEVPEGWRSIPNCDGPLVVNLARLGRLDDADISAELERDATITGAAGGGRSGGTTHGHGQGESLAVGRGGRLDSQWDAERDLPAVLAARSG